MSDPRQEPTPYDPAQAGPVFGHEPTAPAYDQQYQQDPSGQYTTPYPGYPGAAMGPPPQNGAGMTALITGILTFATCCLPLSIVAIISGHIGMNRAKRGEADNFTHAKSGVIMGYIGLGIMLVVGSLYATLIVIAINDPSSV